MYYRLQPINFNTTLQAKARCTFLKNSPLTTRCRKEYSAGRSDKRYAYRLRKTL